MLILVFYLIFVKLRSVRNNKNALTFFNEEKMGDVERMMGNGRVTYFI